jgi:hypothetical protein
VGVFADVTPEGTIHGNRVPPEYVICTLAVLNFLVIIVYGGLQQQKRMD